MRKCCFVIPYFGGKLPNYFQLFLNSCSCNQDFNWLVITDSEEIFNTPENVMFKKMSFAELQVLVKQKFGFDAVLNRPYKLCDYKPAYGFLFEELLTDFRFWGHCDVDTLMGKLSHFVTDELLDKYDKLFCLGHMVLYKNTFENNRFFMSEHKGDFPYKKVFSTEEIKVFDEDGYNDYNINQMYLAKGRPVLVDDFSMNPKIIPTKFLRTKFVGMDKCLENSGYVDESYRPAVYLWSNGEILRYYVQRARLVKEEFMYMHLQSRFMSFDQDVLKSSEIQIVPNRFLDFSNRDVTVENFSKIKKITFNIHRIQQIYKFRIKKYINRIFK